MTFTFMGRAMLAAITAVLIAPLSAQAQDSAYSRLDACPIYQHRDEPVWESACVGQAGWNVYLFSAEHGAAIAYARDGGLRSASMTPPQRGAFGNFHDVIEWRRYGDDAPFATIHRYIHVSPTGYDPNTGQTTTTQVETLIITALQPDTEAVACPVAYVDASAIPNANEVARTAADAFAPDFQCDSFTPHRFDSAEALEEAINTMNDHL